MVKALVSLAATGAAMMFLPTMAAAQVGSYSSAQTGEAFAPDFKGKITLFGNHSGEIVAPGEGKEEKRTSRIGGSLEMELTFEGEIVRGAFKGTGGLRNSNLIGRRNGSACRLFDATDGSVWTGQCTRDGFTGTVKSVPNAASQIRLSFETVGTATFDYGAEERARVNRQIEAIRVQNLLYRIDNGGLGERLDAILQLDSRNWQGISYTAGSVTGVKKQKSPGGYAIYGIFPLADGSQGWARARIEGDRMTCVEYWTAPGMCPLLDRERYRPAPLPATVPTGSD